MTQGRSRRGWLVALALAWAAALSAGGACGDPRSPFVDLVPDPRFPGTPGSTADHAGLFTYQAAPGCAVANPMNLGRQTQLRIFKGWPLSDADVHAFVGGLQRYYSQYGVTLSTAYDVLTIPVTEALVLQMGALTQRVKDATGIDISTTDPDLLPQATQDQVVSALGRAIMYNVREFVRVYAIPRRPEINVVVLPAMVTQALSPEFASFRGLLGLGFSPELLATISVDDPGRQLFDWLGVTDQFTPTAIVGVAPIKRYLSYPDAAMAHELGHAYGLAHVPTYGNLLHQGEVTCSLMLDSQQLARVTEATSALTAEATDATDPTLATLEAGSLTTRARDLVALVQRLALAGGR